MDLAPLRLQVALRRVAQAGTEASGDAMGPIVVVAEDRPTARIIELNEPARQAGLTPDMRYASALSLCPDLVATTVGHEEVSAAIEVVASALNDFSPAVHVGAEPGVFWLDASGLSRLWASATSWARQIREAIASLGFVPTVVVGFNRLLSQAVARRVVGEAVVLRTVGQERELAGLVPLARLRLDEGLLERLDRLGLRRLDDLLRLPAGTLRERFGDQLAAFAREAEAAPGGGRSPTPSWQAPRQFALTVILDDPTRDRRRLGYIVDRMLRELLGQVAGAGLQVEGLSLCLAGEGRELEQTLRPAEPTIDASVLLRLVELRLEAAPPSIPVEELELQLRATGCSATQIDLEQANLRDRLAGQRALARIAARLGADSVLRYHARDAHLPEAQSMAEPSCTLPVAAAVAHGGPMAVVRRVEPRPVPLEPDQMAGPVGGRYTVSGGWWVREVVRRYGFVPLRSGETAWVFWDERRRGWFLQGRLA